MKREYNREKAAYDDALAEYMRQCEEASVDSYSESEDGTGTEISVSIHGGNTNTYSNNSNKNKQTRPPRYQENNNYYVQQSPPPFDLEPPVEADYPALEKQYFGDLSYKLELLKILHSDVCRLTDNALVTLRGACVNISQKSDIIESQNNKTVFVSADSIDTTDNVEMNLWIQLVLWLEAQFCSHETGSAL